MKHLFTLLFLLISLMGKAQTSHDAASDSVTVHINADPRLALIVNKPVQKSGFVGKIRGFRVQIYNGNDRKKANQSKLDFMKAFPGVRSYLIYNNPQFRVRVGDFKTRGEAMQLFNKASLKFNPCMIVPDVINYATPRKPTSATETSGSDD
ncbi:SPOR domain-containing protein [Taibaiella lutea]|uniref:SPOR domain-containing protein n=1 Tax=Taibaiella lutea TaxID=2608001 RepID=A0A5M6CLW9_9BACT|nr:SPOR domain-containing protein [Taibaiella lutea]KAA5536124.1 SPOR domain-containing protein [Taibaiella lutea]